MKQILLKRGDVCVEEVPAPEVGERNVLVRVHYSCISVGTEAASITHSGETLFRRILRHPEKIQRVLQMVQEQGVRRVIRGISGSLSALQPLGYSAAGEVIAVGSEVEGFVIGDLVACAGAEIANHAEVIDVPVNLAVRVPQGVTLIQAATVTMGAIALQGIRRTAPTLGETIAVIGLGILGQLTAQMLKANGCYVIGVDLNQERIDIALNSGMDRGLNPGAEIVVSEILRATDGVGVDAVIVTASDSGDEIISQAMKCCRKKGRIVLVGDVGLGLKREDLYRKELDFLISTSYGPGRYDPCYEEGGQDYPLPYVRWTENRNMGAYLRMLAAHQINIQSLAPQVFMVDEAPTVYEMLTSVVGQKPLLPLLKFPVVERKISRKIQVRPLSSLKDDRIQLALIGAGDFSRSTHLPNLFKLRADYRVHAVMSRSGANAKAVADQYEAEYATTEYLSVLEDPMVDLVMITTRHNLHGRMVIQALRAGKHVFVEKPLALLGEELDLIQNFYLNSESAPVLITGFNRRFSKPILLVKNLTKNRKSPLIINYRMNAGYLPKEHWVQGHEGGGRNIGEACHIYDLFNFIVESEVTSIHVKAIDKPTSQWGCNDNFIATIGYADGSVCSLTYTSMGDKEHPKEQMEIFSDGKVLSMNDYRGLIVSGMPSQNWHSKRSEKGHLEELERLAACLKKNGQWPISLQDQLNATRISFHIEEHLKS